MISPDPAPDLTCFSPDLGRISQNFATLLESRAGYTGYAAELRAKYGPRPAEEKKRGLASLIGGGQQTDESAPAGPGPLGRFGTAMRMSCGGGGGATARPGPLARTPAPPYSSPDEGVCVTSHIPPRGINEPGGDATRTSSRATTARLTTAPEVAAAPASSTSPPSRPSMRRASTAESTEDGGGDEMAPTKGVSVDRLMRRYGSIGEVSPARREPDSPARSPRPWHADISQRHAVADSSGRSSDVRADVEAHHRVCIERRRSSAQTRLSRVTPVTAAIVEPSSSRGEDTWRAEPVIR